MTKIHRLLTVLLLALTFIATTPGRNVFAATTALITLSGQKYNDLNNNGQLDPGEPGLSGFRIYLDLNNNSQFDANEPNAITDANGAFSISSDIPLDQQVATFTLREVGQANWTQTEAPASLIFPPLSYVNLHFGNHFTPPPAEVPESDTIWLFGAGTLALIAYLAYQRKLKPAHRM